MYQETRKLVFNTSSTIFIALWAVIAVAFWAVYAVDLRLSYSLLAAPCAGQDCHYQALTMAEVESLADWGLSVEAYALYMQGISLLTAAAFAGLAIVMLVRLYPQGRGFFFSLLLIVTPAVVITSFDVVAAAFPSWTVPIQLLLLLGQVLLVLSALVFPNGQLAPRWALIFLVIFPIMSLFGAFNEALPQAPLFVLTYFSLLIALLAVVIYRYRRLFDRIERQQSKWVLWGMLIFSMGVPIWGYTFVWSNPAPGQVRLLTLLGGWTLSMITLLALPTTIFIALLRYRLWNIDFILNRTLVYGGLTALITAVYILLVGGMGAVAVNQSGPIIGFVLATALVVAGIRPLRQKWQTAVNRLIPSTAVMPAKKRMPEHPDEETAVALHGARLWLAWLALGLALFILAIFMAITAIWGDLGLDDWFFYLTCPAYLIMGTIIVVRRPANRIGRLCLLIGWLMLVAIPGFFEGGVLATFSQLAPLYPYAFRFSLTLVQIVCLLMFDYLPLLFPTGRYLNKNWRRFGNGLALVTAVPIVLTFIQPGIIFDWGRGEASTIINPLAIEWAWLADIPQLTLLYLWGIPTMTSVLVAIIGLIARWRSSEGQTKQQMKWVVFFLGAVTLPFITLELMLWVVAQWASGTGLETAFRSFLDTVYSPLAITAWLGIPLVIGVAILKDRLYDIDIIINRTLVYGGLSLGIVAVYVLVVGALGALFQAQGNFFFALLATGLIAVLFQPVRARLQRAANRLMFGERDDPYAVLSKLGTQLQTTATPEAMLESVVETIAATLKLPYVAIELAGEQGRLSGATMGPAVAETAEFPLRYQNETVGYLVVSPRSPGESFTERERQLLTDIAGQTGAMAYSVRLTAALQRSREKLVLAREEERRRIRRDLHDELGPTLASHTFALDAALDALERDPQTAAKLLQSLKTQNQATVADIRRLVYELRPPALDELGLIGALQAHVAKLDVRSLPHIHINARPDPLPPLSAAVEVAAYRIALEAMTNAVRHADARRCEIRLQVVKNGHYGTLSAGRYHLKIEVYDDGIGLPPDLHLGVGLNSMRERAEELGGSLAVVNEGVGVRVTAILPM